MSSPHDDTACLPPAEQRRLEFEAAWDAAVASPAECPRPRIADYLRELPDESVTALLPELLRVEIGARGRLTEALDVADYVALFPQHASVVREVLAAAVTLTGATPPTTPPPTVPGFTVIRCLGSGGQATVYLAEQHQPPRRVALKVLPRDPNLPASLRQRFQNEGQSAARLDHPHIARVWDFRYDTDPMYLATEYVEGRSLQEAVADRRTPAQVAGLLARVARAMQHAHERGVIHRDLKPANIMLTADGEPKVIDFGMARRDTVATGHSLTAALTQTGHAIGTPAYMAPEQAEGRSDVGPPADVWALGVILYELLAGRRPFRGDAILNLLRAVRTAEPDWRPVRRASADLEKIARKCLYKEPRDRYPSAAALADDLERVARGESVTPRLLTPLEGLGRWAGRNPQTAGLTATIGLVGLLGLLVTLVVYVTYSSSLAAALQLERHGRVNLALLRAGELRQREPWRVRDLLDRTDDFPRDLRDFVWGHHRAYCEADRLLEGHRATVQSAAFSPDGRRLVTADESGTCRVWDGVTGVGIASFNPSLGRSLRVAFVKDDTLACAADDGRVEVWDIIGRKQAELPGRFPSRTSAVAAARGRWVAAAGAGEVRLWDLNADAPPATVLSDPGTILKLVFSPKGDTLAAVVLPNNPPAGVRGRVRFWDVDARKETPALELPTTVRDVAFDRDKGLLAGACGDATVRLFDAATRQPTRLFKAHDRGATSVAFSPDGLSLATGSEAEGGIDGREPTGWLRVWDLRSGHERTSIPAHAVNVYALAYHPSGERLATGGQGGGLRLTALGDTRAGAVFPAHAEPITALAFARDGLTLATTSRDRTVKVWDAATRDPLYPLAGHEGPIYAAAVRPRGVPPLLATAGLDRTVKLWDLDARAVWGELTGHGDSVNALAFSLDGAVLVSGGDDGEVRLWNVAGRSLKRSLSAHAGAVHCLAFAADGRHFASGGADGVRLWYADGTAAEVVATAGRVRAVAFSPDGRTLALGGDGATRLWDVGSRAERVTLAGDSTAARALAFTHDGRSFAAALGVEGQPGSVRVWDPVTGGERLTLPLPRDDLAAALVFSPAPAADGRHRLAVAGSSGRVTLWEAFVWGP